MIYVTGLSIFVSIFVSIGHEMGVSTVLSRILLVTTGYFTTNMNFWSCSNLLVEVEVEVDE